MQVGAPALERLAAPTALSVAESVTYPNGTVNLVFANSGRPSYGNMAIDEPDVLRLATQDEAPERG